MNPHPNYSSNRAACKQWSAGLGVLILLIGALAGLNPTKMLWAAGPLLLLGLVEAGYAAQERRYAESIRRAQDPSKVSGLPPEPASASVVRTTLAALSLSIWPFYLGLFAIVGIGGEEPSGARWLAEGNPEGSAGGRWQMAASNKKMLVSNGPPANYAPAGMVRTAAANGVSLGPSASLGAGCGSGGCGTSAGCGSGSCGASAGKGCSCGGGGAATAQQMKRPVQPYVQTTAGPMAYQQMNLESRNAGNGGVISGGYPQMPQQGQTTPQQAQMMPQQAQFQRLPNGAIVNARPPMAATNPALQGAGTSPALVRTSHRRAATECRAGARRAWGFPLGGHRRAATECRRPGARRCDACARAGFQARHARCREQENALKGS